MEITPVLPNVRQKFLQYFGDIQNSYTFILPLLVEPSLGNTALVESESILLNRYVTKRIIYVIFPAASYRQIQRNQHMGH